MSNKPSTLSAGIPATDDEVLLAVMGQRGAASALPQNAGEETASDVGNALGAETGGEPIPGARRDAIQGTHPFALTSGDVREPDLQGPRLVRPATVHVTQTKLRRDLLTRGDTLPWLR